MRSIHFIIPDTTSFVSGGNLYNQRLLDALRKQLGLLINCLTIAEAPTNLRVLGKGIVFVDSLYLKEVADRLADKKIDQFFYLIVHHLPSMYSEKAEENTAAWMAKEVQLLNTYDGFLGTSDFTASYLKAKKLQQPVIVLPPIPKMSVSIPTIRLAAPLRILMVANLLPRKGILSFLKILAKKRASLRTDMIITIIGETNLNKAYASACWQLIATNNWLNERVQFRGALSPLEVQRAYQQANLFVSVAAFETFGMALQEAVVFGVPILVVKGGNSANHVEEGTNGFIFDTIDALVEKIIALQQSPQEMKQLMERAFRYTDKIPKTTWEHHAGQLIHFFG